MEKSLRTACDMMKMIHWYLSWGFVKNVRLIRPSFICNGKQLTKRISSLMLTRYRCFFLFSWGIRQESQFTIGDWKYSKVENPIWHKMALTWPVDDTGTIIPVSFISKRSFFNQILF